MKMTSAREYKVKRKLQEQSGSYFVTLPKIWVESLGLKQGHEMSVRFNGIVKIVPRGLEHDSDRGEMVTHG